jgi:thiol-disulfide isomerase/thioredoxin
MCDNGKNKYETEYLKYANAESIAPSLDTYETKYLKYTGDQASMPSLGKDFKSKYLKYKVKYMELKKTQYIMKGGSDINTLYLFKAEWCPHCINFRETWDTIQKDMKGQVNFIAYDADKDKSIMKKYNVEGFPTLMLKTKDKVIEYVGERNINGIKQFIKEYSL